MKHLKQILLTAIFLGFIHACGNQPESAPAETNFIEITNRQFGAEGMQLGEKEVKLFENIVKCNGTVVPLPNGQATVNALLAGVVKTIYCHDGQYVEKNQPILEIAGNEIIDIQKDFVESAALNKRLKSEYERIKLLYYEKVTSEKEFVIAESEYLASEARYKSLKMKLEAIGLSVEKVENGAFFSSYLIKAPVKGYLSQFNPRIGSFVDQQVALAEIADPGKFHLRLAVFATDRSHLKIGQPVRYKFVNSDELYSAEINTIGVIIDPETKSIPCYASMNDKSLMTSVANEFIECEIVVGMDSVQALPAEAILKSETSHYVLVLERKTAEMYYFRKADVTVGRQYNGFSELLGKVPEGMVIVKGAYNILP